VKRQRIYLDHAATTPLRAEAAQAIASSAHLWNFNPSSLHAEGRGARAALDDARDRVAATVGAARHDIVFTSGGTEADNLALLGVSRATQRPRHVIVSAIEHSAVLTSLQQLRDDGTEVTVLPVDADGRVDPQQFEAALRPHTVLASVMYANNEVGTIQPVAALAATARRHGVLFHTDAVAAMMWEPIDVENLGVDLLSISAHKLYGPRGIGALYVRRGVPLAPLLFGGGQESGRRSGTENLAAIVGFARAAELAARERAQSVPRVRSLRDRLEAGMLSLVPGCVVNGAAAERLPSICNVSFRGVSASELLVALDLEGVAVSAGSACATGAVKPSHVLAAMGQDAQQMGGIRFSLGTATTADEVDRVSEILPRSVAGLRGETLSARLAGGLGRLKTNRARLEAEA
jgi:cysteine desulfurase